MLKKVVCLGLLTLIGLAATPKPVTLEWNYDYANGEIPDAFVMYSTTNVALPLTNWSIVGVTAGTNTSMTVNIEPSKAFFKVSASNYWSQEFSNTANTPGLVSTNNPLRIKK